MNGLLNQIFGLGELGFGSAGAELRFARGIPAWAWALVVLGALGLAALTYARLVAPRGPRAGLTLLRGLTLILIALLATGPQLVRESTASQRDAVLVLVDRSASMGVSDRADRRRTRDDELRGLLDETEPVWAEIAARRELVWLGFDGGAFPLEAGGEPGNIDLGEPDGTVTRLSAAMEQALARASGRPVAAVVVLSDGRSADRPGRDLLRRLAAERVPVFAVPLGSPEPAGDVGVVRVDAPPLVFPDDLVPVRVTLEGSGGAAGDEDGGADPDATLGRLELVDELTGRVLAEEEVTAGDLASTEPALLLSRTVGTGEQRWRVRYRPSGADLVSANDESPVSVVAAEDPIRVLYLDGYPRWEQRYLKSLLIREASVTVSTLVIASGRRYLQEGDELIGRIPTTAEDWAPYDVVIIGDLRAELLGDDQLFGLREHIAGRGAGLLWLGGPAAMPHGWHDTPVGDLLPVRPSSGERLAAAAAPPPTWASPIVVQPTPGARRLGLFSIGSRDEPAALPPEILDPSLGWPQLRWAQRLAEATIKPAVSVLAEARPVGAAAEPGAPLVLSMRFGAGSVAYVGTDEIWRWRYGRGEVLFERFWLPLIRFLGRQTVAGAAGGASLTASPTAVSLGEPVTVVLDLLDPSLIDAAPARIAARVQRAGGGGAQPLELVATPGETASTRVVYSGVWTPSRVGRHMVTLDEPLLAAADLSASVSVSRPDDELRRPQTDHPTLIELAERTEGETLAPDEVGRLPDLIPNRSRILTLPPEVASLWDTPAALSLVLLLLGLEWVCRRLVKLA